MAEDGANLFERGALAQHLCGSRMAKYVRAAKWRLHAGPGKSRNMLGVTAGKPHT